MKVRLTHLDGSLPNLALMNLAGYHRAMGHDITFSKLPYRDLFEPEFDRVYGSAIFTRSKPLVNRLTTEFPGAIVGGTGTNETHTLKNVIGRIPLENSAVNYDIYPEFKHSIGFTQRGCRLKCSFCVVPNKEGKNRDNMSIHEIWRGDPWPREIILLDNDFFGQPDWKAKAEEIIGFKFKVNFNQGINVRLLHEEGAQYLSRMKFFDVKFKNRRIYTAWDNMKDEKIVFRGIKLLNDVGIKSYCIMVYMLVGYWPGETMEQILYRFNKLKEAGVLPYPMVYDEKNKLMKQFQRWVTRRLYQFIPWEKYKSYVKPVTTALLAVCLTGCHSTQWKHEPKNEDCESLYILYPINQIYPYLPRASQRSGGRYSSIGSIISNILRSKDFNDQ